MALERVATSNYCHVQSQAAQLGIRLILAAGNFWPHYVGPEAFVRGLPPGG